MDDGNEEQSKGNVERGPEDDKKEVLRCLSEASVKLGVDNQPMMAKQVERVLLNDPTLWVEMAQADKSGDKARILEVFNKFKHKAVDEGLLVMIMPTKEEKNPGKLERQPDGSWILVLEPDLLKGGIKNLLAESFHEYAAWQIMKSYRIENKADIPIAESRHEHRKGKSYRTTHLADATYFTLKGVTNF